MGVGKHEIGVIGSIEEVCGGAIGKSKKVNFSDQTWALFACRQDQRVSNNGTSKVPEEVASFESQI